MTQARQTAGVFLDRHSTGDWGGVDAGDALLNDSSVLDGGRVLSSYRLPTGGDIWVITEAAGDDGRRALICLLLPEEY